MTLGFINTMQNIHWFGNGKEHCNQNGQSYKAHLQQGLTTSVLSLFLGGVGTTHALFPFLLPDLPDLLVEKLAEMQQEDTKDTDLSLGHALAKSSTSDCRPRKPRLFGNGVTHCLYNGGSYKVHLRNAFRKSMLALLLGIIGSIHAVFPSLFPGKPGRLLTKLVGQHKIDDRNALAFLETQQEMPV